MGMFYQLWWEENSNSDKSGCFSDDIICSGTHLLSVLTPMFVFTSWNELKIARASLWPSRTFAAGFHNMKLC